MDPDDNFSPPLDGLARGNKLNQLLGALNKSDNVANAEYVRADEGAGQVVAVLDWKRIVEKPLPEEDYLSSLMCEWWHMSRDPDWWEFSYFEAAHDAVVETAEDDEDDSNGVTLKIDYLCSWVRQENERVDGLTYFREYDGEEENVREFDTQFESPRPLARAVVDTYLPENLNQRFDHKR